MPVVQTQQDGALGACQKIYTQFLLIKLKSMKNDFDTSW